MGECFQSRCDERRAGGPAVGTVGWSCVAAIDDARGGVDVIHGTEGESVSGVCHDGGSAHLLWPLSTSTTRPAGLGEFSQML